MIKIMAAVGLTRQLEERGSHLPSGPTTMTAFDIATAFLNGDMEDKRTYVSFMDSSGRCCCCCEEEEKKERERNRMKINAVIPFSSFVSF